MNNSTGLAIALFGFLGLGAIVLMAVAAQRGGMGNSPASSSYLPVGIPVQGEIVNATGIPVYENEERWELRRGPDRLIEEIIIHRQVTQYA
ncbi:hypothetical protein ES703_43853 [subsurface metagenome]